MKREFSACLATLFIVAFLVGSMSIGAGNSFINSDADIDNFMVSDNQPELEIWSDLLEIYESETSDSRVGVNSFGVAKWKVRWASKGTEITENLTMMVRVNGSGVEELLLAEYFDGWWVVSYNHTDVALLEFSVYFVSSYGMTEFVQLAANVEIIWDRVIVRVVNTNTNITIISTDIEGIESDTILIILGIGIMIFVIVILYVIKKKW